MPEVKPPIAKPVLRDIELFAKAYFNIELTKHQLQLIEDLAKGKDVRISRRMGLHTANKVMKAYLLEGLNPMGRVRLPQYYLPPRQKVQAATQEGKVLAMIKRPGGAFNFELSRIALKYTSVISDLRKDGHRIVAERQYLKNGRASNTYKYYYLGGAK